MYEWPYLANISAALHVRTKKSIKLDAQNTHAVEPGEVKQNRINAVKVEMKDRPK